MVVSRRSAVTRALPKDGVSPSRAGSSYTPSFQKRGERTGHQYWTLGKGRWQPPYLVIDVDAAGPEGGGPIACHIIVSRGLCWGLFQLPGHCGDGGHHQHLRSMKPSALLPPEHCCSTNPGPLGSPLGRSSSAPKRCPQVPQVLTSSFVLWRKKPREEGAGAALGASHGR